MAETRTQPCARCGAPTVEIGLLDGPRRFVMRSCSRCELRTWTKDGAPAAVGDVLRAVATTGRRRSA
jgi:hypothetical protein